MAATKSEDGTMFGQLNYAATYRRIRMTREDYEKLYPPKVPQDSDQKVPLTFLWNLHIIYNYKKIVFVVIVIIIICVQYSVYFI